MNNETSHAALPGSGELEFEEFCILAARFLIEEDEEQMRKELKEAFRFYDKEGEWSQWHLVTGMTYGHNGNSWSQR